MNHGSRACRGDQARTLADALAGADAFFSLSAAGTVTKDMVRSMADKPIIFAMAASTQIAPEEVAEVRSDASWPPAAPTILQINNVLGFPFIFRAPAYRPRPSTRR
jgi:malate dehydrogenase (oxaloacetate-decarboxylating)(NADP+)